MLNCGIDSPSGIVRKKNQTKRPLQLSVIIINYNVKYFLEQCLCSVRNAMKNIDGEIIVVDNNSTDGSQVFFQNQFDDVLFIWNTTNTGFAKANNQAIRVATGDYLLFLNPDTIIAEDCLEKCMAFIKKNNNQYTLGVKMLDGSGRFLKESKRAFPGPMTSLYKLFGLARLFPRSKTFSNYHLGHLNENQNHEVDVLAGAFIMTPQNILEKVQGFDESFFMYGEDIDFSYRIQKAGFKNFYFAETSIIHFKGESTKKGSLNYVRMFYKAMSIFVKKHYGGSKAGIFNLLIQVAIRIRAGMAATARFLKWIGLPVIDASIIFISFWLVRLLWGAYIQNEIDYSPNTILIAFPVFTFLFLVSSYFSGLYDHGYKQSRLNKSALISLLVISSLYVLLPENLRFSRGILLFGTLSAFIFMTMVRRALLKAGIIEIAAKNDEINQTIIAGTQEEYNAAMFFVEKSGNTEKVIGRIKSSINESYTDNPIGQFNGLKEITSLYQIKQIIFCEGRLSFKKIIEMLPQLSHRLHFRFFAKGSHSFIGSEDKNTVGKYISKQEKYRLSNPIYLRTKGLFDVSVSLGFLLVFPLHFFLKKNPLAFFKNTFSVLTRKKTWIGYSVNEKKLPKIRPGIITATGLPYNLNTFPEQSLYTSDKLYAKHYHVLKDLQLIWKNYQRLS